MKLFRIHLIFPHCCENSTDVEDPLRFPPGSHGADRIRSHYEEQFRFRIQSLKFLKCFKAVGIARPVHFDIGYFEGFITSCGDLGHFQSHLGGLHFFAPVILEIGMTGRDKQHSVELILVPGLLCYDQMPKMNGIKGSSQNPYPLRFYRLFSHDPAPFHLGRTILGFSLNGL